MRTIGKSMFNYFSQHTKEVQLDSVYSVGTDDCEHQQNAIVSMCGVCVYCKHIHINIFSTILLVLLLICCASVFA